MTGAVLRAGAWLAVAGLSGVAVVVGGCGAAFPAAATVLLPICFTLLAAAAAFTLDEPASLVVDVTPTGPVRRTGIRAVALLAPLAAGALVLLAAALRGQALPWAAVGLALAGNVLLGFAVACVLRTRTGEPGAVAGTAVVLVLMAPSLVPQVARWVRFPGAAFVLFLLIYGWVSLVTILTMWHQNSALVAVLRLFAPFAFFSLHSDAGGVTAWRGSPWFFIGWQLALCAIAILVALLRGAEGRVRSRIIRALGIAGVAAVILLVLAGLGGFTHALTA